MGYYPLLKAMLCFFEKYCLKAKTSAPELIQEYVIQIGIPQRQYTNHNCTHNLRKWIGSTSVKGKGCLYRSSMLFAENVLVQRRLILKTNF